MLFVTNRPLHRFLACTPINQRVSRSRLSPVIFGPLTPTPAKSIVKRGPLLTENRGVSAAKL